MDANIHTSVSQELASDPHVDADDIVVEVSEGGVSLRGTVPSQAQRTEAVAAAHRVADVAIFSPPPSFQPLPPPRFNIYYPTGVLSIANQIEVQDAT